MEKINVLDHGYIELMAHTPRGDLLVVNAARASFDKEHKRFHEKKDKNLLDFLARERHWLPFRHPSATIRIYVPVFVARQLGKHQVGFSWSEVSRRYITGIPEFHIPEEWRLRAEEVKQGSSEESHPASEEFSEASNELVSTSLAMYEGLLSSGVSPEQARILLPQNMYTTCVWTGTLLAWHTMTDQRMEDHTQKETREYAKAIYDIMDEIFPHSWSALKTYGNIFTGN